MSKSSRNPQKEAHTVRRAAFRTVLVGMSAVGVIVAMAIPAWAVITAPTAGSTVSGGTTITDDGKTSGGATTLLGSACTGSTQMFVDMGTGTTLTSPLVATGSLDTGTSSVFSLTKVSSTNSTNPSSGTWPTDNWGNGTYSVNSTEVSDASDVLFCASSKTTNAHETVTVSNNGKLTYGGDLTGAPGQAINVKATLTDTGGVAAGNGQTVTFSLNGGGPTVTATTVGGVAATTLLLNGPPRTATLTVSYAGPYFNATSTTTPISVTQDPTTTVISPTTSTFYGQTANFTATVASQFAGQGTPTGTVQFSEDGVNAGPAEPLIGGVANFSDASLSAGTHVIGATYSGDPNFLGSPATTANQVVNKAPTSTGLTSSAAPSFFGQAITYTAIVTATSPGPDTGAPSGTVSFVATPTGGGAPINIGGAVNLTASGTNQSTAASISIALLNAGAYSVSASYSPTANFAVSSTNIPQTVNPAQTSVAVVSTLPISSDFGQPVQFTATVSTASPGQGAPTGTVTFVADQGTGSPTNLGTVTLNAAGADASSGTSPAVSTLTPGVHTITATYTNADGNYVSGTSNTIDWFVAPDATTTVVSTVNNVNPSVFGQPVQFQATVTPAFASGGTPVGNVSFFINGPNPPDCNTGDPGYLATITLVNGVATTPLNSTLAVGNNVISACYSSSSIAGDFGASTTQNPQYVQVVNSDPTTTALVSANSPGGASGPSDFGQPVTFTATLTANAPGAGTPLGTVTFADGSTPLATVNLSGNSGSDTAAYTTAALAVGAHAITATYNPANDDFLTSSGAINQVVNQDPTTITVTQNGASVQGQPVSFTATVTANAPGAGTPTGSVEFFVNGSDVFGGPIALIPGTPTTGSTATSPTISSLTPGGYQVTATYSGDIDFLTSSDTIGQIVNQAGSATTLTASPSSSSLVYGTPVTLTATVAPTGLGTGAPTGSVDFYDGTTLLGAEGLTSVGGVQTATLPATVYGLGGHSFKAVYLGEYDYTGSTSNTVAQSVTNIATTTSLASSLNPSNYTQTVTLTATVTPATNAGPGPGGTVTFTDGSTVIGTSPVALSGTHYVATLSGPFFSVGTHNVTASYSGSTDYGSSTSSVLSQVVNKDGTIVVAQASTNTTMTATLVTAQGAPIPSQTLSFTTGTTALCTAVTAANGVASCTATGLGALSLELNGTYTATFAGNASFLGSSGSAKG